MGTHVDGKLHYLSWLLLRRSRIVMVGLLSLETFEFLSFSQLGLCDLVLMNSLTTFFEKRKRIY